MAKRRERHDPAPTSLWRVMLWPAVVIAAVAAAGLVWFVFALVHAG